MREELSEVLRLLDNSKYKEAFILLNSLSLNEDREFKIIIPEYFRVGQLERENKRRQMFHLYFIDVYDDSSGCHFYRTLGKLFTDIDRDINDITEQEIKKYFIPQFKDMLRKYLRDYDRIQENIIYYLINGK